MGGDVLKAGRADPARHSEAEVRLMLARRPEQRSDAVRQRDVVVVEADDELAAGGGQAEVARPGDTEAVPAEDAERGGGRGGERPAIVDDDHLQIPELLGRD